MYYLYILKCQDKTLYTGIAVNLAKRLAEHNFSNQGAKYTRSRRPVKLAYAKKFRNRSAASKAESRIKALSRKEKLRLIYESTKKKIRIIKIARPFSLASLGLSEVEARERARILVLARLKYWNQFYKFNYNRVTVKGHKGRWGSCSRLGNLNFNYRIIFLPLPLADYIVVHELCHLAELNHGPKFWGLVGRTVPDWPARRQALRRCVK